MFQHHVIRNFNLKSFLVWTKTKRIIMIKTKTLNKSLMPQLVHNARMNTLCFLIMIHNHNNTNTTKWVRAGKDSKLKRKRTITMSLMMSYMIISCKRGIIHLKSRRSSCRIIWHPHKRHTLNQLIIVNPAQQVINSRVYTTRGNHHPAMEWLAWNILISFKVLNLLSFSRATYQQLQLYKSQ